MICMFSYTNIPKYMFIMFIGSNLYRNYKLIKVLLHVKQEKTESIALV